MVAAQKGTLPTSGLASLINGLYQVRKEKAALEKTEKAILAELKLLADPEFDAFPDNPVSGDGLVLSRSLGTTRTIAAEMLLERGISPDIINYATKTTVYFRYTVKPQKAF
jgi:hypothetical protein